MNHQARVNFGIVTVLKAGDRDRQMIDSTYAFNIVECIEILMKTAHKHNDIKDVKEFHIYRPEYYHKKRNNNYK